MAAAQDSPAASGLNITATSAEVRSPVFFTTESGERYMCSA